MQRLWFTGIDWDDQLPDELLSWWHAYIGELHLIEDVRLQRWIGTGMACESVQLHGFSDASQLAYAACVYARVLSNDGTVTVSLLAAKTKVATIKQQTIPNLELAGAALLARLLKECKQAMKFDNVDVYACTDATIVLAWLRRHASVWRSTYVANRVSIVQSTMCSSQWHHVPGTDNPADLASRGAMPSELCRELCRGSCVLEVVW